MKNNLCCLEIGINKEYIIKYKLTSTLNRISSYFYKLKG